MASIESCIKNSDQENDKLIFRRTVTEIISHHNRNNKFKNENNISDIVVNFQNNYKDLICVKADKGYIMVAANKIDYNQTIENNLEKINLFSRWKNKRYINEVIAYRLKTHSSVLAKAYALPKVHKAG